MKHNMLTRVALALVLAGIFAASTTVHAQDGGTRVAIIEMNRILGEAAALRSIQAQGEAQRKTFATDAQAEAKRLREVRAELKRQETLLAPDALQERQREFNLQVRAADQKAQQQSRVLRRAVQQGETEFRDVLRSVVADIAKRRGVDVVVPVNRSLYAIAELNLTDEVLERINDELPEITLQFSAE